MFNGKSAEHLLISELTKRGFLISTPVIDGDYDMVIDNGNTIKRVQVKSTKTTGTRTKGYQCQVTKGQSGNTRKKYNAKDVDIAAVYIMPAKVWFFIPMSLINVKSIYLYPNEKKGKFEQYQEYWKIFEL